MKTRLLILGACVLCAAQCWTQQPADPLAPPASPREHPPTAPGQTPPLGDPPFLLVYLARYGENAAPRIALGLEKPTLKIGAFESSARLADGGIAVQLTPEDARTLVAAMKAMAALDATSLPNVLLWFTTPDNRLLDCVATANENEEENIVKAGVIDFGFSRQPVLVAYLAERLHFR